MIRELPVHPQQAALLRDALADRRRAERESDLLVAMLASADPTLDTAVFRQIGGSPDAPVLLFEINEAV